MSDDDKAALRAETQAVQAEMNQLVMVELSARCAQLRLENAALRRALEEAQKRTP